MYNLHTSIYATPYKHLYIHTACAYTLLTCMYKMISKSSSEPLRSPSESIVLNKVSASFCRRFKKPKKKYKTIREFEIQWKSNRTKEGLDMAYCVGAQRCNIMYIYYIYICMCVHVCTYTYIYIPTYVYIYIYMYVCADVYIYIYTYTYVYVHIYHMQHLLRAKDANVLCEHLLCNI